MKCISDSICPAVISFTDRLSSTEMSCTFPRPFWMRWLKSVEQQKMGTELCYVFTGDIEDHTMRLLAEIVKSDISA